MSSISTRAGWSEHQPDGSTLFIPKDLPPEPPLEIGSLWRLAGEAERHLGWLAGYARALPSAESFGQIVLAKEAVYSSRIEGSRIGVADLLTWKLRSPSEGRHRSTAELRLATNYVEAASWGMAELENREFNLDLLLDLHRRLYRGVRGRERESGKLRESEIWIGPPGSTIQTARYVPPLARLVPELMQRATQFADTNHTVPTLITTALLYYQLEATFPFLDGNGRVARLAIPLLLSREQGVRADLISLSAFFSRDLAEQFFWLEQVRQRGDWEGWVAYFLRGIREAVDESVAMINSALEMRRQHIDLCARWRRSSTAGRLLDQLLGNPVVSVETVSKMIGRTFANANELVRRFEELGLLVEVTGRRRNRRFCYEAYLWLFEGSAKASESYT